MQTIHPVEIWYELFDKSNTGNKTCNSLGYIASRNSRLDRSSDWSHDKHGERPVIASSHACDSWKRRSLFLFRAGCSTCSQMASRTLLSAVTCMGWGNQRSLPPFVRWPIGGLMKSGVSRHNIGKWVANIYFQYLIYQIIHIILDDLGNWFTTLWTYQGQHNIKTSSEINPFVVTTVDKPQSKVGVFWCSFIL